MTGVHKQRRRLRPTRLPPRVAVAGERRVCIRERVCEQARPLRTGAWRESDTEYMPQELKNRSGEHSIAQVSAAHLPASCTHGARGGCGYASVSRCPQRSHPQGYYMMYRRTYHHIVTDQHLLFARRSARNILIILCMWCWPWSMLSSAAHLRSQATRYFRLLALVYHPTLPYHSSFSRRCLRRVTLSRNWRNCRG